MKKKRGRPKQDAGESKDRLMQIRLAPAEKQAFAQAADLVGQTLSVWVRDQLRQAAARKLQEFGRQVPFLDSQLPAARV
jgi:uncharacterized protein (DUF1778 family)